MNKNEIVIFETEDKLITLPVEVDNEMVWLNRNQMAELFDRDVKTIGKHINNALREELESDKATVAKFATVDSSNSSLSALFICLPIVLTSLSKSSAICWRLGHTVSSFTGTSSLISLSSVSNNTRPFQIKKRARYNAEFTAVILARYLPAYGPVG